MRARRRGEIEWAGWAVATVALLTVFFARAEAKPRPDNVHQPDANCATCHTDERPVLERNPETARTALAPDIEVRCTACHDEGPSHPTGMAPRKPVPETLPLSGSGQIACATCHFMHGEHTLNSNFLRVDNRHGALCLTCHELSELQNQ